jgi:BirA family biotin operon repressor/biotin-[acetyl-CoA-carboxylase] ligase
MTVDSALLRALRSAEVHLLPGDLAAQLGLPLAEVETALQRLRDAGFDIETRPGLGCRLLAAPDRLIADDLHARLGGGCEIAREIMVFSETSSTNDVASKLGRQGHPGGVAIFAERQTAGRGRFGRRWDSADHAGLWFSLLLRPAWPMVRWPRLTTWAGVAVAATVERVAELEAKIKWPNDVLVAGKKVAGILIESATDSAGNPFAVAGIGLNVNQSIFPEELAPRAASLLQIAGRKFDRSALAAILLQELEIRLPDAAEGKSLLAEASRRSALLGHWVRLQAGSSAVEGNAENLDDEGNLLIRLSDGSLHRATAGEVTSHLR